MTRDTHSSHPRALHPHKIPPSEVLDAELELIDEPHTHLAVDDDIDDSGRDASADIADLETDVLVTLANTPMSRDELRRTLRVRNERLGHVLHALQQTGRLTRSGSRWTVPVPVP